MLEVKGKFTRLKEEGVAMTRYVAKGVLILFLILVAVPGAFTSADTAAPSGSDSGYYVLAASGPCLLYDTQKNVLYNGDAEKLEGKEIAQGDTLDTGGETNVILLHYPDLSRMTVGEKSSFTVKDQHSLWLSVGKIWVKISKLFSKPGNFQVESPNAVAVAHGTQFEVAQDTPQGASSVHVFEGVVSVGNDGNLPPISLTAGHYVSGVGKGEIMEPRAFDLKNLQDPWWKWNLAKERRLNSFFTRHHGELMQMLRNGGAPGQRMFRIRSFMRMHGFVRGGMRRFLRDREIRNGGGGNGVGRPGLRRYYRRFGHGGQMMRQGGRFNQMRQQRLQRLQQQRQQRLRQQNKKKKKQQ